MPPVDPIAAGPGQESVWDYPRPPRLERSTDHVTVRFRGALVCDTRSAIRVLETSHPPTYYLPVADFVDSALRPCPGTSFCEWKGRGVYFDVVGADGKAAAAAAWGYPEPTALARDLVDHVALYAAAMDECLVDGERVEPQPGSFYGGWITSRVVGPFKGVPGSAAW